MPHILLIILCALLAFTSGCRSVPDRELPAQANAAMRTAATYYHSNVASHGGYVYYYTPDLSQRWGEGRATRDQIWIQAPGTPTVGMAYLKAYAATGDEFYLNAAKDAANALVWGQLVSGGWNNHIEFNLGRLLQMLYRGEEEGHGTTSLDDGQTQAAIKFMIHMDHALLFKNEKVHKSAMTALEALLAAQFPNGAFPQGWTGPSDPHPVVQASYPDYDWRTEGRIKEYWLMYTLNDNVIGYIAETLADAWRIYKDERYLAALKGIGDFLLLAQMPDPQPAWAQQYSYDMKPIWARRFEPPAIAGHESQEAMLTLLFIYEATGDSKYLKPIPDALAYLKRSLLPDGTLSRFYELQSNKPLYMISEQREYSMTYEDADLPSHYGWKFPSRLDMIEWRYSEAKGSSKPAATPAFFDLEDQVREIIHGMDDQGRWITLSTGERIIGQPNWQWQKGFPHISSDVFSRNMETLSAYLIAVQSFK